MNEKFIENVTQQFSVLFDNMPKGKELPGQHQVKAILQNALSKLDLVTRDEFEAQAAVLKRTREKIDALEIKMQRLEDSLDKQ